MSTGGIDDVTLPGGRVRNIKKQGQDIRIVAVSGGPDSVYLVHRSRGGPGNLILAHYNHGARGEESDKDQAFVESMGHALGIPLEVGKEGGQGPLSDGSGRKNRRGKPVPGFEGKAREVRYRHLRRLKERSGATRILVAHTADDQVETILMRLLDGAGISGLKGIPRATADGVERPLLDTWRKDILAFLKKHAIPYREDRSNRDTRFERNWVRHVLLPLLEARYGESVKKRIFTLGERFREIDEYLECSAGKWREENEKRTRREGRPSEPSTLSRKDFAALPSLLRIRILQSLCFERVGTAPNERLLTAMDRLIVSGGPSARLSVGRGVVLRCRYGEAVLSSREPDTGSGKGRRRGDPFPPREPVVRMKGPGVYGWSWGIPADGAGGTDLPGVIRWEEGEGMPPERVLRMASGERAAIFDAEGIGLPLSIRPLRAGDRIRPFGLDADKKVKEVLIERKVPREERWGRPVVCDSAGNIVWIPGVLRSALAPVTRRTRRMAVLRAEPAAGARRRRITS